MAIDGKPRRFQGKALQRSPPALALGISETGIGIQSDKQQIIFEAFQQADASTSRVYGGTGLGLTISRELARLLGGEIQLRSTPGSGSTFTLYLPLDGHYEEEPPTPKVRGNAAAVPSSPQPPPVEAVTVPNERSERSERDVSTEKPLEGARLLVVDDDVRNLFAVTSLLERLGAQVLPAGSAKEAFAVYARNPDVHAILMDMMMPEMDGYQATRELRKDPNARMLPIIALTAKAMPGDREKAIEAGCTDFVPKPVDRDSLVDVLLHWVHPERAS